MTSWVYIFSQFTPEALLFEALVIFLLVCGYSVFWVLRKRRYGAVESAMPAGPVREYLNELIGNAEQIRAQLFGLLAASGHAPSMNRANLSSDGPSLESLAAAATGAAPAANVTPIEGDAAKKLAALEAKLAEQAKAMDTLVSDKSKLEKDLASAKSAASGSGAAPAEDVAKLQAKISELEGKLAEYNVIEDDLANLKRLQQENAQLKATLASAGAGAPAAAAAPAPAPAAPAPAPVAEPAAPAAPAPVAAAPTAPSDAEAAFAGLAADVDQSLSAAPAAAAAMAAPVPPATDPAAAAGTDPNAAPAGGDPAAAGGGSTDADLVAEFEKMLKG